MPDPRDTSPPLIPAIAFCALATLLALLPTSFTEPVRSLTRDAALPGTIVLDATRSTYDAISEHLLDRSDLESRIAQLEAELADANRGRRAAELALTSRLDAPPTENSPPLVDGELVVARVLGSEAASAWRAGLFADVGADENLREDAEVLAVDGPLVDRGRDGDVNTGDTVLDGRIVVGRLRAVGRWTSVVQPVTSAEYRVRARIAHRTRRGLVFGPTGILRGTDGPTCRLEFVGSTEAVEPGDEVYTIPDDSGLTEIGPLLLGRVGSAELPPGAPHWEIEVTPAAPESPRRIAILRRRFNPSRLLAN